MTRARLLLLVVACCLARPASAIWSLSADRWVLPLARVTTEGTRTVGLWPDSGIDYFTVTVASRAERDRLLATLRFVLQVPARMRLDFAIAQRSSFDRGAVVRLAGKLWMARAAELSEIALLDARGDAFPLDQVNERFHELYDVYCGAAFAE